MIIALAVTIAVLALVLIIIHRDQQRITKHYQNEIQQHINRLSKIANE